MIDNSDIENIFDYKDYDGENQFTVNLKSGDIFIYKTYDIVNNKEYIFKMIKTDKKHKSCNQCPIMKGLRLEDITPEIEAFAYREIKNNNGQTKEE